MCSYEVSSSGYITSCNKNFKIPLKTILLNRDTTQPVIDHLVFEMNDLVIHTYHFIILFVCMFCTNVESSSSV